MPYRPTTPRDWLGNSGERKTDRQADRHADRDRQDRRADRQTQADRLADRQIETAGTDPKALVHVNTTNDSKNDRRNETAGILNKEGTGLDRLVDNVSNKSVSFFSTLIEAIMRRRH